MSLVKCGVMRSPKYLVDAEGELWSWPYSAIRNELRCTADANTFASYAVINLGFICLEDSRHGMIVSLRPEVVCPRALASTIFLLSDMPPQRTMLSVLSKGWQHRLFQSPSEVVPELVAELQRREVDQSDFLRRPRHVDEIRGNNAFAHLMRAWTNAESVFDCEQLRAVVHRMLRGRFVLLEPQRDSRTLIIEDWGHAYGSFDRRWLAMSRGLRFEDQPDYRYANAAMGGYYEVLRSGQPLLDEVDAIISRPRYRRSRIQYRRLILPIRGPTGEMRLLSTSLTDSNINLRARIGHER
jgi:hypothetical protein